MRPGHPLGVTDPGHDDVRGVNPHQLRLSAGPTVLEELRPLRHAGLLDDLLGVASKVGAVLGSRNDKDSPLRSLLAGPLQVRSQFREDR